MRPSRDLLLALLTMAVGAGRLCAQVTTIDSGGNVGQFSSVMIGSDGLPLISYGLVSPISSLKVAHCNDAACATPATINTLDPDNAGIYTSIALGTDGRGLISC